MTATSVAAGQSGKDTWHDDWQLMIGFSTRPGMAANHCTRWLANERMPCVRGDSWYSLAEVVGSEGSRRSRSSHRVAEME
ncbi:hypothetical protein Tco_1061475 [Tanacetum coccineum]